MHLRCARRARRICKRRFRRARRDRAEPHHGKSESEEGRRRDPRQLRLHPFHNDRGIRGVSRRIRASGRIQRFLRAADGARRRLRGRDLGRRPVRQGEHDRSEGSVRRDHNMGGDTDAYVTQRNFEKKGADSE